MARKMKINEGLGGKRLSFDENDEERSCYFDDQNFEYWGGGYDNNPEYSAIENNRQEQYSQTFEKKFLDEYEDESTPSENFVPPMSDAEIETLNNKNRRKEIKYNFNLFAEIEKNEHNKNRTVDSFSPQKGGLINSSVKSSDVKKEQKISGKIPKYSKLVLIYFFLLSYLVFGFSELIGFSLKTSFVGRIIEWTVLAGASIYGIAGIMLLIGGSCFVLFYLLKHMGSLFSKYPNQRHRAWKETENSFRQLGKGFWAWAKVIFFIVGALTILRWL
jgi:hypothetical protein